MNILKRYAIFLEKKPVLANMITSGFLFGTGDLIAQKINHNNNDNYKDKKIDFNRTLYNVIYGGIIFAPIANKLYRILNNKIYYPFKINNIKLAKYKNFFDTICRVSVDQLIWSPIGIVLYFSMMTVMENWKNVLNNPAVIKEKIAIKIDTRFRDTLLANWSVWPIFQIVNFSLVPLPFRVSAVNIVSILWNAFLSNSNNSAPTG